jgi:tRNA A-37 threonylcarbamoyl transferase component Bud32
MFPSTKGLIALHQSFIGCHGHLTSANCLINDRWQVKISDYGLGMIHESQPTVKRSLQRGNGGKWKV